MKKLFLLAAVCFTASTSFSQTFRHGAGVGYSVDAVENADTRVGVILMYVPRIDFLETSRTSFSVALPITVGASVSGVYSSSYGSSTEANVHVNVPVMLNFNMGAGSSRQNHSRFGGFFGGGFGFHTSASSDEGVVYDYYGNPTYTDGTSVGPAANGGFRIGFGQKGKNIEIRLAYFHGLTNYEPRFFTMGCLFNF